MVPGLDFMVPGWCSWFFYGSRLVFMVVLAIFSLFIVFPCPFPVVALLFVTSFSFPFFCLLSFFPFPFQSFFLFLSYLCCLSPSCLSSYLLFLALRFLRSLPMISPIAEAHFHFP